MLRSKIRVVSKICRTAQNYAQAQAFEQHAHVEAFDRRQLFDIGFDEVRQPVEVCPAFGGSQRGPGGKCRARRLCSKRGRLRVSATSRDAILRSSQMAKGAAAAAAAQAALPAPELAPPAE